MVWYKTGAADDPRGKSGIAHFLEHLMFKGTRVNPGAAFSALIARNGGRDNAFTTEDYTVFHETVATDRLDLAMRLEADRMTGLVLDDAAVLPERDVILEERRMRIDNDPSALLREQLIAGLYLNASYHHPTIGWHHDMRGLGSADSRLHKALVLDKKLALSVGAGYSPSALGLAEFGVYATPKPGVAIADIEAAVEAELHRLLEHGVEAEEVAQAARRMQASAIYSQDSLSGPANIVGTALAIGRSLDEVAGPYDSLAFHRRIDDLAGQLRFSAAQDEFDGSLRSLKQNLSDSADLLRLALAEPRFAAEDIERIRGETLAGLARQAKNPRSLSGRLWMHDAFEKHPYGSSVDGSEESVGAITRDDLAAFVGARFHRSGLLDRKSTRL